MISSKRTRVKVVKKQQRCKPLALVKSTRLRDLLLDFELNVKIQDKVISHKSYRQSNEPIKSQSNHVIGVKHGKMCVSESRLVGIASDWTSDCKWRECLSTKQET